MPGFTSSGGGFLDRALNVLKDPVNALIVIAGTTVATFTATALINATGKYDVPVNVTWVGAYNGTTFVSYNGSTYALNPVGNTTFSRNGTQWLSWNGTTLDVAAPITSTGAISGTTGTFSGDVAVNGEDITCDTATAATVFNTNATSVAIGGAGTVDLGGGSGSTGCTVDASGNWTCAGDVYALGGDVFGGADENSSVALAGGSGADGCTVTGDTGAFGCTAAITAGTDLVATAGDVQSGDDVLIGDDATFSTADPVLLSTGAGLVTVFNTVATSAAAFGAATSITMGDGPGSASVLNWNGTTLVFDALGIELRYNGTSVWSCGAADCTAAGDLTISGGDLTSASTFNVAASSSLVNIAGGYSTTGCTIDGSAGDWICTHDLYAGLNGDGALWGDTISTAQTSASVFASSGVTSIGLGWNASTVSTFSGSVAVADGAQGTPTLRGTDADSGLYFQDGIVYMTTAGSYDMYCAGDCTFSGDLTATGQDFFGSDTDSFMTIGANSTAWTTNNATVWSCGAADCTAAGDVTITGGDLFGSGGENGDINLAGGTAADGCTITGSSGLFACAGGVEAFGGILATTTADVAAAVAAGFLAANYLTSYDSDGNAGLYLGHSATVYSVVSDVYAADPANGYLNIARAGGAGNIRISGGDVLLCGGSGSTGVTITDSTGDLATAGDVTAGGDLAVNGATSADITTTTAAASVFNTTATTLNIGGAATTLVLNAAAAVTTLNGTVNQVPGAKSYSFAATPTAGRLWDTAAVTHTATDQAGTVATWYGHSLGVPTVAGFNSSVIVTDAATLFVAAPVESTMVITNHWAAWLAGDVNVTGDISAAGGFKDQAIAELISDIPASSYNSAVNFFSPWSGSVVGVAVRLWSTTIIAGTITCSLYINGADITGHDLSFTSSDAAYAIKSTTIPKDQHAFAADQSLTLKCTGSADLNPNGTADVLARVFVEQ